MLLLTYCAFIIVSFFSFYIPGNAFLFLLKIKEKPFEQFILSWVSGIALFILLSYFCAYCKLPSLTLVYLLICLLFYVRIKYPYHFSLGIKKIDRWLVIIIAAGSLSFLALTFFSGFQTTDGMQFVGVNAQDGIVHLAYIKNQVTIFPPQHPGLAGVLLRGYHYFYDFLLSRFVLFYRFGAEDLFFRLFPLLINILYGASILLFSKTVTKRVIALRIILFLSYFSQSTTSFLVPFLKEGELLGISEPLLLVFDPSIILGISFLMCALYAVPKIKNHLSYGALASILLGILLQIKVYAGVIGIGALVLYTIYFLLREKDKRIIRYVGTLFIVGVLSFLTFGINNFGMGGLLYAPLLFYEQYLQQPLFNSLHWEIKMTIYRQHHNIIRIIQLFIEAIGIFLLINIGSRFIILIKTTKLFSQEFWKDNFSVILFFSIVVSILIPSLFIQTHSAFNSIQFLWLTLVLLCIPTGIIWASIFQKNLLLKIFVFLNLFFFSVGGYFYTESLALPPHPTISLNNKELHIYKKVARESPTTTSLIVLPLMQTSNHKTTFSYHLSPLVASLTGRSAYYEGEITPYVDPNIIEGRKDNLEKLTVALAKCDIKQIQRLIKKIGSHDLVSPTPYMCLDSEKLTEEKIESKTISFYSLR